ncbi:MAG: hypothetical protein ACAI38_25885 [Myxococcota bacterium]|nr:hypothetical protein [Myxococcota bacterium]
MQPIDRIQSTGVQVAQAAPATATPPGPVPGFARVKQILDGAISAWHTDQQREPHLEVHGPSFKWGTRDELLSAAVELGDMRFPLIDESLRGNGRAEETYIIRYLRADGDMFARMPSGGPYLPDDQIDEIARWINAGCPENAPGQQGSLRTPDLTRALAFAQRYGRPANGAALQLAAPRV